MQRFRQNLRLHWNSKMVLTMLVLIRHISRLGHLQCKMMVLITLSEEVNHLSVTLQESWWLFLLWPREKFNTEYYSDLKPGRRQLLRSLLTSSSLTYDLFSLLLLSLQARSFYSSAFLLYIVSLIINTTYIRTRLVPNPPRIRIYDFHNIALKK